MYQRSLFKDHYIHQMEEMCAVSAKRCLLSNKHVSFELVRILCSVILLHNMNPCFAGEITIGYFYLLPPPPPPPRLVFPKPISVLASIVFIASSACCYKVLSIYHCVWALVTQTTTLSFWGQVLMCCISAVSAWSPSLSSFTLSLLFSPVVAVYSVCRQDKRVIISYLAKGWRREESLY